MNNNRRVLQDYFGYHVQFVMNITDIDDKIIKRYDSGNNEMRVTLAVYRARQRHLLTSYLEEQKTDIDMKKVIEDVVAAIEHFKVL